MNLFNNHCLAILPRKIILGFLFICIANILEGQDNSLKNFDLELPTYIQQLTTFGQRADWHPGKNKLLFLEKTYGDVYEYDFNSKKIIPLTHHFYHGGFTRALYLANGDILLSGCMQFDAENAFANRVTYPELWVLDKSLTKKPVKLGEKCSEGPAVSRYQMKIAWTQEYRQYPERLKKGEDEIYIADIEYINGIPELTNKERIFPAGDRGAHRGIETQNFMPPGDSILIFTSYDISKSEVMGLNLKTGDIVNYSNNPRDYDEPEGIFPDGKYTLVECDKHVNKGVHHIDIWKLALDQTGDYERITYFYNQEGYKSSNPVISDNGKYMAFQVAKVTDPPGVGRGIFIYDFNKKKKCRPGHWISLNTKGKPEPRHENAFIEVNGLFYLLGGRGIKPVSIFDPETKTWTKGAAPPVELHHFQAIQYHDEIYVIGAMTGDFPEERPVDHIYVYSPRENKWKKDDVIPEQVRRGAAGAAQVNTKVYLSGGIINGHLGGYTNRMDVYDLQEKKWKKLSRSPHERDHFHCVALNGKIYAIGGRITSKKNGQVFASTIPEIDVYTIETDQWETLETCFPTPRAGASTVIWNNKIVLIGGESENSKLAHNEVEVFHPTSHQWSNFSSLNIGRHGTQAIVYKNKIYIASGSGNKGGSPELESTEEFRMDF